MTRFRVKRFRAGVAVLSIAACMSPASAVSATIQQRVAELEGRLAAPDGQVMIVAHRGCWSGTSENTLDAIESCIAFGIDMVELDVRSTSDGKLVLLHDDTVDRMTDGTGLIAALTWEHARRLRIREGKGGPQSRLTNRSIPTLEDALRLAKDRILVNIDAKGELNGQIQKIVERTGTRAQVLFKSSAPAAEVESQAWTKQVAYQPIIRQRLLKGDPVDVLASFDSLDPVGYEIDVVTPDFIPKLAPAIRERCARFWVNSLNSTPALHDAEALVNPDAVWGLMIAGGVDTIQTDEPLALKAWLAARKPVTHRCESESASASR